jgi:hypothetical protein
VAEGAESAGFLALTREYPELAGLEPAALEI